MPWELKSKSNKKQLLELTLREYQNVGFIRRNVVIMHFNLCKATKYAYITFHWEKYIEFQVFLRIKGTQMLK